MKWYQEVTKEIIADFKEFTTTVIFKFCGPNKMKLNKDRVNKIIMTSQLRGSIFVLDELLKLSVKEESDKDSIVANIHIMRMNLWNEASEYSDNMKKVDLATAMEVEPELKKLYKFVR